jgi:hypothetical protein
MSGVISGIIFGAVSMVADILSRQARRFPQSFCQTGNHIRIDWR